MKVLKKSTANSKPSSWQATAGWEGSRNGWFNRSKHRTGFHNVKVCGKIASADIAAAERFCDVLEKNCAFIKPAVQRSKFVTLMKTAVYWKKGRIAHALANRKGRCQVSRLQKIGQRSCLGAKAPRGNRLKPLLVYHFGNRHALKGINKPPYPCISDRTRKDG